MALAGCCPGQRLQPRSGLDSLLQSGQVAGHLVPGLAVNEEGDEDSADAVALEVDRDSQARPRLGQGFDSDLNGGPDGSVDATDTPRAGAGPRG